MNATTRITTTEFQTTCLALLDRLADGTLPRLEITKHGRVIAVLTPPEPTHPFDALFGAMKGCVIAPPGYDFTGPIFEGEIHAEQGRIHE
jgi:antitoxin (DNA-binding transcriptional repressor) of toxin-antitoxin stability system